MPSMYKGKARNEPPFVLRFLQTALEFVVCFLSILLFMYALVEWAFGGK